MGCPGHLGTLSVCHEVRRVDVHCPTVETVKTGLAVVQSSRGTLGIAALQRRVGGLQPRAQQQLPGFFEESLVVQNNTIF